MSKIDEAKAILKALGMPAEQQNEMAALTLLALCNIKENAKWSKAERNSLGVSKGIMTFVRDSYGKAYAPNTRETFRRHILHQFVQSSIADYNPDNPNAPVNSPKAHYAISENFLRVVRTYNTRKWDKAIKQFILSAGSLSEMYLKKRDLNKIPVKLLNGKTINLSSGKHNEVQASIIELFAPRFANGGILLYLGDTAKKNLFLDEKSLNKLGIPINLHSKLPDVVIYDKSKNWLFLIEAVTSHGPVSPKRYIELEALLKNCTAGRVYVTAFPDFAEFKKHSNHIAWETEVWLMDIPDHMIHFNGDRFMGPR
jgi:type II restriction enzyme